MARLVGGLAGAAVGFWVGGPAGARWGWMIGSTVAGIVSPDVIKGPRIGDAPVQTAQDGIVRPIVYGKSVVAGNIIGRSEPRIVVQEERQGKGGPVVETERMYQDFAIRVCESYEGGVSEVIGISRIWENEKLVYDVTGTSELAEESADYLDNITIYLGTESQLPDSTLESIYGVGNVPSYRGTCYAVFRNIDLTEKGLVIPQYRFEVSTRSATISSSRYWSMTDRTYGQPFSLLLSSDGTTATTDTVAGQPSYPNAGVRASKRRNGGRWYFEIEITSNVTGDDVFYGIVSGDQTVNNATDASKYGIYSKNGLITINGGTGAGSGAMTQGDRFCCLADLTGGYVYLGRNGYITATVDTPTFYNQISGNNFAPWFVVDKNQVGQAHSAKLRVLSSELQYWTSAEDASGAISPKGLGYQPWHTGPLQALIEGTDYPSPVLPDIVEDIADRVGISASEIDVSDLAGITVDGYAIREDYSAAECIRPLQRVFLFDSFDADLKTHFVLRGGAAVLTLTEDDLLDDPEFDEDTREQELEYPRKLHLQYTNADLGYVPTKQTSERVSPDIRVRSEFTVEVPVHVSDDFAAQLADKMHRSAWADLRGTVKLQTTSNYAQLTAADAINLTYRGRTARLRIEKRMESDGVLTLECKYDRLTDYASNITAPTRPPVLPDYPRYPGDTEFVWMNLPVLSDDEDFLSWHVAVTGEEEGWRGARVDVSENSGATYTPVSTIEVGATIGYLLAELPSSSAYVTDYQNEIRVSIYSPAGVFESATRDAVLRGANALALVGDDGISEIVQVQDWTEESANVWVGTTLLRGRKRTPPATWPYGTRVVLLTGAEAVEAAVSQIGAELYLRATSLGQSPDDSEELVRTYSPAVSQQEWAPSYLELTRSGNDLTIEWSPSPRLGNSIRPIHSAHFEGYRVTLTKGANSVTFDQTATTVTYDTSALGSAPVNVSVQGLNRYTGAGVAATGSA